MKDTSKKKCEGMLWTIFGKNLEIFFLEKSSAWFLGKYQNDCFKELVEEFPDEVDRVESESST